MRRSPFIVAIIFLVLSAATFAQTANPLLLKKTNTPQRVQAPAVTDSKIVRGSPQPSARPDIGTNAKTAREKPQPSARPDIGKGGNTAGKSPPQAKHDETPVKMAPPGFTKGKQTPHPMSNGMIGTARMHRPPRMPSNLDAGDPLTKLYQAHKLLNRLSAAEPDDSRKAAYGTAKKLVGKAIKIINTLRGG